MVEILGMSVFFALVGTILTLAVLFVVMVAAGRSFREVIGCIYVVAVVIGFVILQAIK